MKRKKFNPAQFAAAKKFATEVSGYDQNSPIWGTRLPEVIDLMENWIKAALDDIGAGAYGGATSDLNHLNSIMEELKKRLAKGSIISAQMK